MHFMIGISNDTNNVLFTFIKTVQSVMFHQWDIDFKLKHFSVLPVQLILWSEKKQMRRDWYPVSTITTLLSSFFTVLSLLLKTVLYEYKLREKIHNFIFLKKGEEKRKTSAEYAVTPEYTFVYLGVRVIKAGQSPQSCARSLL